MEIVGNHLQEFAIARTDPEERDQFARSAFNRYYYATYLNVKSTLGSFKSEWSGINHSSVPDVLEGAVKKELVKGRERALRADDPGTAELCSRAVRATILLSQLMTKGYASRVTADYNPEVKIDFADIYNFELNYVAVKAAALWPSEARMLLRTIDSAWRQVRG